MTALLGVAEAEAALAGGKQATLSLRVTAAGAPVELGVESVDSTSTRLMAGLTVPGTPALPSSLEGSPSLATADERIVEHEATLDLRHDLLSREAALRLVDALGPPADPLELIDSASAVGDRIAAVGELNLRTFGVRHDDVGAEASGAVGAKVGAGFERVESVSSLAGAFTRPPGEQAFVQRTDCVAG